MSIFDKVRVKTALARTNKFSLPSHHITTQDFFTLRPVYYRELIPGQSISIDHSNFSRLMPLDKPMFGGARFVNRGFFVPYRTIFPYFNDFISDTESVDATGVIKVTQVPWCYNKQLADLFKDGVFSSLVTNGAYDFVDGTDKYKFTSFGRKAMTILNSVGISVDFTKVDANDNGLPISLLNLLAFYKVYLDWYINPAYDTVRQVAEADIYSLRLGGQLTAADMVKIKALMQNCTKSLYDNDYFTAAFDNPLVPNDGTVSSVIIPEIKDYSKGVTQGADNNSVSLTGDSHVTFDSSDSQTPPPYIEGKSAFSTSISGAQNRYSYRGFVTMLNQYMLDSLKALSEYVKRYQLVGSRTLDRYMANFGVQLDAAKLNRSIYLGKNESPIEISDVMSTANTDTEGETAGTIYNTPVGDYTGKGISYQNNGHFDYKADEFGCIIILSTIIPNVGYVQGVNRMNLHIDRFDFFTPDFDSLGTQAIARGELFNDGCTSGAQLARPQDFYTTGVFGYQPRYSEYCVANDWLTSDFRYNSRNAELQTWHLFRMFSPTSIADWNFLKHHSENFLQADQDQYDRIFNYDLSDYDHFIVVHRFDVETHMAKKPLFDQFDWDEGRTVLANLNGTRMN